MKASEVLAKAADLIEPVERWTQDGEAFNADGNDCNADDGDAVCWCALGALWAVGGRNGFPPARDYLESHLGINPGEPRPTVSPVATWNDLPDRTQSEVVTALRSASKLAEERGE